MLKTHNRTAHNDQLSSQRLTKTITISAIPNLGIKKGVEYAWRGCRQQGRFLLLQNLHSRHPWRLQIFAPRQLLSDMDVMNTETFFCPASPKAPTVGALYYTPSLAFELPPSPPWMSLRRSSTSIPHTLRSAKLLKLGIADNNLHLNDLKCDS